MTSQGGSNNDGTIFSFDTSTNTFTLLHSFDSADGLDPYGDLLLSGDTLYGMTLDGGTSNDGVIFAQTVPEPTGISVLVIGGLMLGRRRRK
jgi:uncharacterized repeat protein (TIGR03803 family)